MSALVHHFRKHACPSIDDMPPATTHFMANSCHEQPSDASNDVCLCL